jgi:phosphosulfolactate synthase
MDFLSLPQRTTGQRTFGITSIADFGTPLNHLEGILQDYHQFVDIAKIGIGSAYVTPNLSEKISLYKRHDIHVYFGGTLFEKCYFQGKITNYIKWLKQLGVNWIEVSNGTIDIPLKERLQVISMVKDEFTVVGEVGSKDAESDMPLEQWKEELHLLIDAGCRYVITEGRDSGTSGIYSKDGAIKKELIKEMVKDLDVNKLIFEAPTPKSQMFFINQFGSNVNLGNVKLNDVLVLEAQRNGLRSETFFLEEKECNLPL